MKINKESMTRSTQYHTNMKFNRLTYPKLHTGVHDNWDQANKNGNGRLINLQSVMLDNDFTYRVPTRFRMIPAWKS